MTKVTNEVLAEFISEELKKIDQRMAKRAEAYVSIAEKLWKEIKQNEIKPSVSSLQSSISNYTQRVKDSSADALKMAEKSNKLLGVKAILIYVVSLTIVCFTFAAYLLFSNKLVEENQKLVKDYNYLYDLAVKYENFINSSKKIQTQYKTWNKRR